MASGMHACWHWHRLEHQHWHQLMAFTHTLILVSFSSACIACDMHAHLYMLHSLRPAFCIGTVPLYLATYYFSNSSSSQLYCDIGTDAIPARGEQAFLADGDVTTTSPMHFSSACKYARRDQSRSIPHWNHSSENDTTDVCPGSRIIRSMHACITCIW